MNLKQYTYRIIPVAFFLSYIILGTGLHGDDFATINQFKDWTFLKWVIPSIENHEIFLIYFPGFLLLHWNYLLSGLDYLIFYDLIKILVHLIAIFFVYKFFRDFMTKDRALITSLFFLLNPVHDSTIFWYMCLTYVIAASLIMYSFNRINHDKNISGFVFGLIGSFSFYSSPPFVLGLSTYFFLKKEYKKAVIFITPGILFISYYIFLMIYTVGVEQRIDSGLGLDAISKNFFLQIFSLIDSLFGPNYFIKIYHSIGLLSIDSLMIIFIVIIGLAASSPISKSKKINKHLLAGILGVLVISFLIYSLTGLYNHSTFNLGNRSTLYGSLLIAYLIGNLIPSNKILTTIIILMFLVLPNLGLSNHWKDWNKNQLQVIKTMDSKFELLDFERKTLVIVKGNLYSKLGNFSHIEFLIMPWNFKHLEKENVKFLPLSNYLSVDKNQLLDSKWDNIYSLDSDILLYDTELSELEFITKNELIEIIKSSEKIQRHWIQTLEGTRLQSFLLKIYPSIEYLFYSN